LPASSMCQVLRMMQACVSPASQRASTARSASAPSASGAGAGYLSSCSLARAAAFGACVDWRKMASTPASTPPARITPARSAAAPRPSTRPGSSYAGATSPTCSTTLAMIPSGEDPVRAGCVEANAYGAGVPWWKAICHRPSRRHQTELRSVCLLVPSDRTCWLR
jgi:hypothetical protein